MASQKHLLRALVLALALLGVHVRASCNSTQDKSPVEEEQENGEPTPDTLVAGEFNITAPSLEEDRILGGVAATSETQFPYMVWVHVVKGDAAATVVECGGVLVSLSYAVTSAQCLVQAADIEVTAGTLDTVQPSLVMSKGQAIIHPDFVRHCLLNDIALVYLFNPFTKSAAVAPIYISSKPIKLTDMMSVKTMGFGDDPTAGTTFPGALSVVDMGVMTLKDCNKIMKDEYIKYPDSHMCLNTAGKTKGFCAGDRGGPVVYQSVKDNKDYLVGVLSDGLVCPTRFPNAFTVFEKHVKWVKSKVSNTVS